MFARALVLTALVLRGTAGPAQVPPPAVVLTPVPLVADEPGRTRVGRLTLLAGFALAGAHPDFGGLSALLVEPDGGELVALSDRGRFWRARPRHDARGRLTDLVYWRTGALGSAGVGFDPEGLARLGATVAVVAEGRGVLHLYPDGRLGAAAMLSDVPEAVRNGAAGDGIEALADLGDGRLLMLAERLTAPDGAHRAWIRAADGGFAELGYRAAPGFAPTGADRQGDTLYVLERAFGLPFGFAVRIVRVPVGAVAPGARLEGEELARLQAPFTVDNFDAIAARAGPDGRVRLYILSDDNFLPLQRTLLMQFAVDG